MYYLSYKYYYLFSFLTDLTRFKDCNEAVLDLLKWQYNPRAYKENIRTFSIIIKNISYNKRYFVYEILSDIPFNTTFEFPILQKPGPWYELAGKHY